MVGELCQNTIACFFYVYYINGAMQNIIHAVNKKRPILIVSNTHFICYYV